MELNSMGKVFIMQIPFKKVALAIAASALACPAMAASGLSFSGLSGAEYDTAGVYVKGDYSYTADIDDGGGFDQLEFKLWDDGTVKFSQVSSLSLGSTGTFHFDTFYPGLVGTGARGVGLYLYDSVGGGVSHFIDPYDVPHYADPSGCRVDCGPVGVVPEPETYAMLMAGLGLLGAVARRRKSADA
jgi:PEP-CTERM motif